LVAVFGNAACLKLLTHLHNNYGKITEQELEDNVTRMRAQRNPPTSIELIFVQIEDGVSFAVESNDEPTKPTIIRWAYDTVAKTGCYDLAFREWRQFDLDKKNWENFKLLFKAADRDMHSQDTTGTAGQHGANAATSDVTLITTTQAALADSEIQLAQALSRASLSSSSRGSNRSTETTTIPDICPRAYCWTHGKLGPIEHHVPVPR
jgi:hypothetical protein